MNAIKWPSVGHVSWLHISDCLPKWRILYPMRSLCYPGTRTRQWEQTFLDWEQIHVVDQRKKGSTNQAEYVYRELSLEMYNSTVAPWDDHGATLNQDRAKVHIPSFPPKTLLWSLLMSHLESWSLCNLAQSSAPFFLCSFRSMVCVSAVSNK